MTDNTPQKQTPKYYSETRYIMQRSDSLYTIALKDDVYECNDYTEYLERNVIVTFDLKQNRPVIIWCSLLFGFTKRSELINWIPRISEVCVDMSYGENDDKYEVWDVD